MLLSEMIRVVLFVSLVIAVYVVAGWTVGSSLYRRFVLRLPAGRGDRWIRRLSVGLASLGVLCFAYGKYVEPYWPEVTRVRIESSKLPAGTRPIRLVHISDLHSDRKVRLEERLPDLIAAEKPDLIAFTGDSLNTKNAIGTFRSCMERLAKVAPTFAVKGNWDTVREEGFFFGGTGVREVDGEAVRVEVAGAPLWIAGVAVGNEASIGKALRSAPPGAFTIFLYHYPDEVLEVARRNADLYLAGHTHGGQVALPFYGALMTRSRFGKRFEAGLYRVEDTWLYVNRGIGLEGGAAPRVRFCARPEITVIEIAPGSKADPGAEYRR